MTHLLKKRFSILKPGIISNPLVWACGTGDASPDIIALLLNSGADVMARSLGKSSKDRCVGDTCRRS